MGVFSGDWEGTFLFGSRRAGITKGRCSRCGGSTGKEGRSEEAHQCYVGRADRSHEGADCSHGYSSRSKDSTSSCCRSCWRAKCFRASDAWSHSKGACSKFYFGRRRRFGYTSASKCARGFKDGGTSPESQGHTALSKSTRRTARSCPSAGPIKLDECIDYGRSYASSFGSAKHCSNGFGCSFDLIVGPSQRPFSGWCQLFHNYQRSSTSGAPSERTCIRLEQLLSHCLSADAPQDVPKQACSQDGSRSGWLWHQPPSLPREVRGVSSTKGDWTLPMDSGALLRCHASRQIWT